MSENNQPMKTIKVGNIKAAIWENESEAGRVYHSVSISRIYKDSADEWQETNTFGRDDLARLSLAANSAMEFLYLDPDKSKASGFAERVEQGRSAGQKKEKS